MFFRRTKNAKSLSQDAKAASSALDAEPGQEASSTGINGTAGSQGDAIERQAPAPLSHDRLRRRTPVSELRFKTSSEADTTKDPLGHEVAIEAVEFGAAISADQFHICACTPPGTAARSIVLDILRRAAAAAKPSNERILVTQFEGPDCVRVITLPYGRGAKFASALSAALDDIRDALPAAFTNDSYQVRARAISEQYRSETERAIDALHQKAYQQNIAVLRTPSGYAMAPMLEGKVVRSEVFSKLPPNLKSEVERKIAGLEEEMSEILAATPAHHKQRLHELAELDRKTVAEVIAAPLSELRQKFSEEASLVSYLDEIENQLSVAATRWRVLSTKDGTTDARTLDETSFQPFLAKVLAGVRGPNAADRDSHADAPVIEPLGPAEADLVGASCAGGERAGYTRPTAHEIEPGAMFRADGGFLVIDAADLVGCESLRNILRTTLRTGRIPPFKSSLKTQRPAAAIPMQPIPVGFKCVLLGSPQEFDWLRREAPDLIDVFKVHTVFDEGLDRTADNEKALAARIAHSIADANLLSFEAGAIAALIDYSSELASNAGRLSLRLETLNDVASEADHIARRAERKAVKTEDVTEALHRRHRRSVDLTRVGHRGAAGGLVDAQTETTKEPRVGAIMAVATTYDRDRQDRGGLITCLASIAPANYLHVSDSNLDSAIDATQADIVSSYLTHAFEPPASPLHMSATLTAHAGEHARSLFSRSNESSAAPVSLACTCAVLSALSATKIRSDIAVLGGIDQTGAVRSAGDVNTAVATVYDSFAASGLKEFGVVIPKAQSDRLMLREDIVSAAQDGKFKVWAVADVGQCLEVLSDNASGTPAADGTYPRDTIMGKAQSRLLKFANPADNTRANGTVRAGTNGAGA